jgi:hypothetical protein
MATGAAHLAFPRLGWVTSFIRTLSALAQIKYGTSIWRNPNCCLGCLIHLPLLEYPCLTSRLLLSGIHPLPYLRRITASGSRVSSSCLFSLRMYSNANCPVAPIKHRPSRAGHVSNHQTQAPASTTTPVLDSYYVNATPHPPSCLR